jgi:hypothetical protein
VGHPHALLVPDETRHLTNSGDDIGAQRQYMPAAAAVDPPLPHVQQMDVRQNGDERRITIGLPVAGQVKDPPIRICWLVLMSGSAL